MVNDFGSNSKCAARVCRCAVHPAGPPGDPSPGHHLWSCGHQRRDTRPM